MAKWYDSKALKIMHGFSFFIFYFISLLLKRDNYHPTKCSHILALIKASSFSLSLFLFLSFFLSIPICLKPYLNYFPFCTSSFSSCVSFAPVQMSALIKEIIVTFLISEYRYNNDIFRHTSKSFMPYFI